MIVYNVFTPSTHSINSKSIVYRRRNKNNSNIYAQNKNSLDFINNENFNYNFNSNKKPVRNLKQNLIININNYLSNDNGEDIAKKTSRQSSTINKQIFLKTRSVERRKVKQTINNLYKENLTSNNDKNDNYFNNNINLLLSETKNKNKRTSRYSNLNNNYVNIISEENELDNEKIYDMEIRNLMKERDNEINNIIVKYQNKISKMQKNKNVYFKKRIILNDFDSKNKNEDIYNDIIFSSRGKINYSNSSSSLNKITTGCDEYK